MSYTLTSQDIDSLMGATITSNSAAVNAGDALTVGDYVKIESSNVIERAYFGGYSNAGIYVEREFDITSGGLIAEIYFPSDTITGFGVDIQAPEPSFIITQTALDVISGSGAELYSNDELVVLDQQINIGDYLEVKTLENYVFTNDGFSISMYNDAGIQVVFDFSLNEEKTIASYTADETALPLTSYTVSIFTEQAGTDITGTNNVYLIDNDILQLISEDRFERNTAGDIIDFGDYVISVIELPFQLGPEMILEDENIFLADKNTEILAPALASDLVRLDLGEIAIPENNGNSLDYEGVTTTLYLPRCEPFIIDVSELLGNTISIEYQISVYTGIATVNIYNSKYDSVFLTKTVSIGVNVPYALTTLVSTIIDNSNVEIGGDNGILKPFLAIDTKNKILNDGFFTVPISDEGLLAGEQGYFEIENLNLKGEIGSYERNEILNSISQGVIIK